MDFKKIFLFKEMMLIATTKPSFNITSGYPWEFLQMPSNPIMKSPLTWLLVVTLGSASGGHVPGTTLNGTLNLVYLFPFMGSVGTLPAISVAVKEIHRRELLLDYAIDWQLWDSGCNSYTGKALFELNSRIYNILKLTCRQTANIRHIKFRNLLCSCLFPIHWSQVLASRMKM